MAVAGRFVLLIDEEVNEFSEILESENTGYFVFSMKPTCICKTQLSENAIKSVDIWSSYSKKNITRWLKDMNFRFSWQKQISYWYAVLATRAYEIHTFSPPSNILSVSNLHDTYALRNNYILIKIYSNLLAGL